MFFSLFMDTDFRLLKSMHTEKIAANEATNESYCLFKWNFLFLSFVVYSFSISLLLSFLLLFRLFVGIFISNWLLYMNRLSAQCALYIIIRRKYLTNQFWRLPFQHTCITNINSFELHRYVLFHCIVYIV